MHKILDEAEILYFGNSTNLVYTQNKQNQIVEIPKNNINSLKNINRLVDSIFAEANNKYWQKKKQKLEYLHNRKDRKIVYWTNGIPVFEKLKK